MDNITLPTTWKSYQNFMNNVTYIGALLFEYTLPGINIHTLEFWTVQLLTSIRFKLEY